MEDMELQEKPGFFSKIAGVFSRPAYDDEEFDEMPSSSVRLSSHHRYAVTVRRQIVSFQDAVAAADGLKRGDQQILNLSAAAPDLREKIKDFMCGVNYSQQGSWEELGENVYLLAPPTALVEVAPSTPRMAAVRN